MRPLLLQFDFTMPVAFAVIMATLVWSTLLLRRAAPIAWGDALRRAVQSLLTFGSAGSTEKTDISVPGSLGTVAIGLGVYGLVREPVHIPIFGYAAMAFCGFAATAAVGWKTGPKLGVPPDTAIRVAFLCAFFGILGSRLFFVLEFSEQFKDQPARVALGRLLPEKGQSLSVQTERGTAQVAFDGTEKTQEVVVSKISRSFAAAGVHATVNKVKRRQRDVLEEIDRGIDIETDARGAAARLVVSGSVLPAPLESEGFSPPWWEVFAIWHGGLVYYGGMLFGTAAILIFVRMQGQRVAQVADLASSVGALGIAFGRVGCFLNGCCWGRQAELPWSIRFPVGSPAWLQHVTTILGANFDSHIGGRQLGGELHVDPEVANALTRLGASDLCSGSWPLHPVQIYAILLDLGMFAIIFPFVLYKAKREWQTFFLWFIVYGVVRFIIEHFRGDHDGFLMVMGYALTPSQRASLVTMPFGIAGFIWASRKGRPLAAWTPPPQAAP